MGASASFELSQLNVIPGEHTETQLRVRNTGNVVDQFTFEPIGDGAEWISVAPAEISLFPAAEETVVVSVDAPRAPATRQGTIPFALRVVSREDAAGSVVEEGLLHVEAFDDRRLELLPTLSSSSRQGRHQLAVDNHGNAPSRPAFVALDPEDQLRFEVDPSTLTVEPGTAGFTTVKVRPKERFWRGQPKRLPFQIVAAEDGHDPVTVDGALLQQPRLPRWIWKALLALLALLILLFILWKTLLEPSIESTARDSAEEEVQEEVAAIDERLDAAGIPEAPGAGDEPGGATTTVAAGATTTVAELPTTTVADTGPTTTSVVTATTVAGSGTELSPLGKPIDFRLSVVVNPGATGTNSFTVPAGQVLSITDIVLQNPTGATGDLRIQRSGTTLFETQLANYRDLDYHFVSPYQFGEGSTVDLEVICTTPGPGAGQCGAAASFAGFQDETAP
ncbi:MAG: hypothetical protein ACRDZZ_08815 [Ilumatobacteraceae bacterium]